MIRAAFLTHGWGLCLLVLAGALLAWIVSLRQPQAAARIVLAVLGLAALGWGALLALPAFDGQLAANAEAGAVGLALALGGDARIAITFGTDRMSLLWGCALLVLAGLQICHIWGWLAVDGPAARARCSIAAIAAYGVLLVLVCASDYATMLLAWLGVSWAALLLTAVERHGRWPFVLLGLLGDGLLAWGVVDLTTACTTDGLAFAAVADACETDVLAQASGWFYAAMAARTAQALVAASEVDRTDSRLQSLVIELLLASALYVGARCGWLHVVRSAIPWRMVLACGLALGSALLAAFRRNVPSIVLASVPVGGGALCLGLLSFAEFGQWSLLALTVVWVSFGLLMCVGLIRFLLRIDPSRRARLPWGMLDAPLIPIMLGLLLLSLWGFPPLGMFVAGASLGLGRMGAPLVVAMGVHVSIVTLAITRQFALQTSGDQLLGGDDLLSEMPPMPGNALWMPVFATALAVATAGLWTPAAARWLSPAAAPSGGDAAQIWWRLWPVFAVACGALGAAMAWRRDGRWSLPPAALDASSLEDGRVVRSPGWAQALVHQVPEALPDLWPLAVVMIVFSLAMVWLI